MDTTLKTLTSKEFVEALIVLFGSPHAVSVIRFIFIIIVLRLLYPLFYKVVVDIFFERPKRKLEERKLDIQKQALEYEKEQNVRLFKNQEEFIQLSREQFELVNDILKTLQISPSNHKYEVLVDCFLGVERNFGLELKSRLLNYVENKAKEKFLYVKKEIINAFKDKVLNRLSLFVYQNSDYINKVYELVIKNLDVFLNKFVDVDDIEKAKKMLDNEKDGLVILLIELRDLLVNEYYNIFGADCFADYLKRIQNV